MIHEIVRDCGNSKWIKCNACGAFAAVDAVLHFAVLCHAYNCMIIFLKSSYFRVGFFQDNIYHILSPAYVSLNYLILVASYYTFSFPI